MNNNLYNIKFELDQICKYFFMTKSLAKITYGCVTYSVVGINQISTYVIIVVFAQRYIILQSPFFSNNFEVL